MTNFISSLVTRKKISPVCKFTVIGKSMEPAIHEGSTVLACKVAYHISSPKKGHIVVLRHPDSGRLLLKRIEDISEDNIFLLGDNQSMSTDSRQFGSVKRSELIGKVFAVI